MYNAMYTIVYVAPKTQRYGTDVLEYIFSSLPFPATTPTLCFDILTSATLGQSTTFTGGNFLPALSELRTQQII